MSTNNRRAARPTGLLVLGAGLVLLGISQRTRRQPVSPTAGDATPTPPAPPAPPAPASTPGGPAHASLVRRTARTSIRACVLAFLLAAIAAFVFIGIGPLTGRYRVISVLSGSMRPSMPPGSLVVSTPEPLSALRLGQIVTFQAPTPQHQVVTHRVIQIIKTGGATRIRTKGDANVAPDGWTAQIQGNTVWHLRTAIPNAGRLVYWFRQPAVHRLTVDIIPALVIALILWAIWGPDSRSPNERTSRRPVVA